MEAGIAAVDGFCEPCQFLCAGDLVNIAGFCRFCFRCAVPRRPERHDKRNGLCLVGNGEFAGCIKPSGGFADICVCAVRKADRRCIRHMCNQDAFTGDIQCVRRRLAAEIRQQRHRIRRRLRQNDFRHVHRGVCNRQRSVRSFISEFFNPVGIAAVRQIQFVACADQRAIAVNGNHSVRRRHMEGHRKGFRFQRHVHALAAFGGVE